MIQATSQPKKPLLRALSGESLSPPPLWLMRQAGRYLPEYRKIRATAKDFLQFCYTPDLAVEVTLQPLRRYGMDAAILFSDILVVPDALGQKVQFREGEGPVLEPVDSPEKLSCLSIGRLRGHLAPVYETVHQLSREIPQQTTLIGFAGSPWTVAVYMVEGRGGTGCGKIRAWAHRAPDDLQKLIDLLVEATAVHLVQQVENGVEVIQLFDSWAGVLGESQFRRWVIAPTAALVGRLRQACPDVPIIGFPRGAGLMYEAFANLSGVDAIGIDSAVPVDWAAANLQGKSTVQGNLDNQALVVGGKALEMETRRILEALAAGPFIFNLGHGVLQETPPEHVHRLVELIRG